MLKITPVIAAVVAAIAVLNPPPARAQANRTFVSGFGLDSDNCSFQNPCRTFAAALLVTNPKGEIAVLDPADYGAVTITQSVSIVNDGVGVASITQTVVNADAITINTGASDVVNLRGLTLTGGVAGRGINMFSGGTLNVQNCVIRGFNKSGILFQPGQSSTLTVLDTIVSNNNLSAQQSEGGIIISPQVSLSAITVNVYLDRVQASGNGRFGIFMFDEQIGHTLSMTIADSVVTGTVNGDGVVVSGGGVVATLINTRLTNNLVGFAAESNATAYLAETVISGNSGNGFVNAITTINSFGNNRITDTNNFGSLTPIAKQ